MDINCSGSSNGKAFANVQGGTEPYTYLWNDPSTSSSDSIFNLNAGNYILEVTDLAGCIKIDSIDITEPAELRSSISDTTHGVFL